MDKKIAYKDIKVPAETKFDNIEAEQYRTYQFADCFVTIAEPVALHVSDHGSHFVIDSKGVSHYVRANFVAIEWKNRDGYPNIRFTKPSR